MESRKEDLIKLFKKFISNEKHMVYPHSLFRDMKHEIDTAYVYSNQKEDYNRYGRRICQTNTKNKYLKNGRFHLFGGDIKHINSNTNITLEPLGEKLPETSRNVEIYLNEQPALYLCENISSVREDVKKIENVRWVGVSKIFNGKIDYIEHVIYKKCIHRTIRFGDIICVLSEKEFNELYSMAEEASKTRGAIRSGVLLDERLKEYEVE